MRWSSCVLVCLLCLLGCRGSSTTHGGFERASASEGLGLQKVNNLVWKASLDAEHPVLRVGRTSYVVRDSSFSAVDAAGKPTSTQSLEDKLTGPMTVVSGRAYYGSGKDVVAVEFPSGKRLWKVSVSAEVTTAPAVLRGVVVVAANNLVALDATSGTEQWTYAGDGEFSGAPAARGDDVFAATSKGWIYAINVDTGQPRWSLETPSSFEGVPVSLSGEMAIVPGRQGIVWGVFADTGRERWRFPTGGVIGVGVSVHDGRAWIGTEAGDVSSVDIRTGQEVWRMTELPAVVTSPTWAAGAIYVGCDDGKVVALDAADGAHKWSFQLESEPRGAPQIGDGEIWMTDGGGRVYYVK